MTPDQQIEGRLHSLLTRRIEALEASASDSPIVRELLKLLKAMRSDVGGPALSAVDAEALYDKDAYAMDQRLDEPTPSLIAVVNRLSERLSHCTDLPDSCPLEFNRGGFVGMVLTVGEARDIVAAAQARRL